MIGRGAISRNAQKVMPASAKYRRIAMPEASPLALALRRRGM
jgi:hypothetical protein